MPEIIFQIGDFAVYWDWTVVEIQEIRVGCDGQVRYVGCDIKDPRRRTCASQKRFFKRMIDA
jgi:hypothetical protein